MRPPLPLLTGAVLLLAGCITPSTTEPGASQTSATAATGPLQAGDGEQLAVEQVFSVAIGDGGDVVAAYELPERLDTDGDRRNDTGLGLLLGTGPDATAVQLDGVLAPSELGDLHVGPDGTVTALARLDLGDLLGLHLLRVAPTGEVTRTEVTGDAPASLSYRAAGAFSPDGGLAAVASLPLDDGADARLLTVQTLDTATGAITATGTLDREAADPDVVDLIVRDDGSVDVLMDDLAGDGTSLAVFPAGLTEGEVVPLDPAAATGTAALAQSADGGAVVVAQNEDDPQALLTRLITVAPGAGEAVTAADLPRVSATAVFAAPEGWTYVQALDYAAEDGGTEQGLLPVELATGERGERLTLCADGGGYALLAAAPSGSTAVAVAVCRDGTTVHRLS